MKEVLLKNEDPYWRKLLSKYISKGQSQKAIDMLNKIILNDQLSLFKDDPTIQEERKIALLMKIELFREWKKDFDALAWLCLECELHPDHNMAQLLKDQLKQKLNLRILSEKQSEFEEHPFKEQDETDWPDVAGMRELKTLLNNNIIKPVLNPHIYKAYRVTIPNGIIFYGPPGCGKTFIARKLAEKLNYNFIEVKPGDLASIYVHGTQEKITSVFKNALLKSPTLIFFDEFHSIAPSQETVNHSYGSEVSELLVQMDNLNDKNILIVAATNYLSKIDKAVLRQGRFDQKIFIPPPDYEARMEALQLYMALRPQEKINWSQICDYTENYTFAELKNLVEYAARLAANKREKIKTDHLIIAITEFPASLNDDEINKYK